MRIPFSAILTVLTLALSCVPAVLIWAIFSSLMGSSTDLLYAATADGIDAMVDVLQDLLLNNSLMLLNARLAAGEKEHMSKMALLNATGLVNLNLRPNATDIRAQVINRIPAYDFPVVKHDDRFSYTNLEGTFFPDTGSPGKTAYWVVWQSLNVDVYKAQMGLLPYGRTLYLCTVQLSKDELWNTMEIWYVDQTTGAPLVRLSRTIYPWQVFAYSIPEIRNSFSRDLFVNPYSGQVEITFAHNVQVGNQQFAVGFGLNSQSLSEELRAQLGGHPADRLFLFFRRPHGHLIAASHGKYFSLSDVDLRFSDPVANPPNVSAYVLYTCLNSTDPLIVDGCQKLIAPYNDWTLIPESRQEMVLQGRHYWVAVGYSDARLTATMVLLKDRQAVMGGIDADTARVRRDTAAKQGTATVVLGVTTAVATVLPLLIGLWLGNWLLQLARKVDRIARLEFGGPALPTALTREIHDFQQSFRQMERGLRAFGQFVPSAVVARLVAGRLATDAKMEAATITVMFADIEQFSSLAEVMPPAQLAAVCTEYFEVLCKNVVQCQGTVDKFIGDCVMALWNAPLPNPRHERLAVTAALRMQADLLIQHPVWVWHSLPALKFRLGLHTGSCLVGNFGCSYRVSYTCLGDDVNVASRLEALNKKFGTVVCVSQSTFAGCAPHFHFRHLSKVTVPGRSEVLSVYEPICVAAGGDSETGEDEDATPGSPSLSPLQPSSGSRYLARPVPEDASDLDLELSLRGKAWASREEVRPAEDSASES
eukprot:EG_transcript_4249